MKKHTVLFCTGISGSGKSYFVKNILPKGAFYALKSATNRPARDGEQDGREYYFHDEAYFETEKFATKLFVNEQFWKPGDKKWLYGVPEFEVFEHLGANLTYDVIQPKYVRQMIDWFNVHKLNKDYDFRILWFLSTNNNQTIIENRKNMPHDLDVRKTNTCNLQDFQASGITPDHVVICNPKELFLDRGLRTLLRYKSR